MSSVLTNWEKCVVGNDSTQSFLEVSNAEAPLPLRSIRLLDNFVSADEVERLHGEIDARRDDNSNWEGFDGPRRRVQRYDFSSGDDASIPASLVVLQQRLKDLTGLDASHVKVEEYPPPLHKSAGKAYDPTILTLLASHKTRQGVCLCQQQDHGEDKSCSCFVVEIPLLMNAHDESVQRLDAAPLPSSVLQSWNQPMIRQDMCWKIRSPQHWTDVRIPFNSAIVKQSDMLSEWRSSRFLTASVAGSLETVRVLKLCRLSEERQPGAADTFGYVPSPEEAAERERRLEQPMPPLADLLTIIITTSPIKSNPSTIVLEKAMDTFKLGGNDFAFQCRKVIVCDGFRRQNDEMQNGEGRVSKKHSNTKQAMRNGIVNGLQADNYGQFKRNLRKLCSDASNDKESVFFNVSVVELEERFGYGYALRHALRNCVDTPFVCVVQHDRTFMRPTPVYECVRAMWHRANIKYVGFSMRSNLMYRDIFLGKYSGGLGQAQNQEYNEMVLYPPELSVPATEYGPDSASTAAMVSPTEKLQKNILALAETYQGSGQASLSRQASDDGCDGAPKQHQMTLVPTLFWYDNVHICDTAHYRDFIFHPDYKMVARGGFVEDKTSPVLKRTIERLGLKRGHSRFGCYLLDDHSGLFFTGHLDGGSFITTDERKEIRALQTSKEGQLTWFKRAAQDIFCAALEDSKIIGDQSGVACLNNANVKDFPWESDTFDVILQHTNLDELLQKFISMTDERPDPHVRPARKALRRRDGRQPVHRVG